MQAIQRVSVYYRNGVFLPDGGFDLPDDVRIELQVKVKSLWIGSLSGNRVGNILKTGAPSSCAEVSVSVMVSRCPFADLYQTWTNGSYSADVQLIAEVRGLRNTTPAV